MSPLCAAFAACSSSAAHGGGCFSGKDPTKVDRSAAYMARYIAKNLVAAGLCRKSAEQFVLIHSRPVLSHKKLFHDSICRREEKCVHREINCG